MKFADPRLWVALVSSAVVLYLVLGDLGRKSPGPVTAVHARSPDLDGGQACAQCHGGWFSSMTESCLDCHEEIGAQFENENGLHGTLGRERALLCALCHSEHHGEDFAIVNRQSFAQAGASQENFDHQIIGWRMDGKHLELSCRECHKNADAAILPPDEFRFIGLDRDCASCHEDAHDGRMTIACASCHGQQDFRKLESLGHEKHLPLVGGHANVSCLECHKDNDAHSLEALGEGSGPGQRDCIDCHESPHRSGFVEGVAELASMRTGAACVVCHEHEHNSFREEGLDITPEQHAHSGFPLAPPHADLACDDCHSQDVESFAERHPGRGADECRHCHEDPHGGQFDDGPFGEQGCVACHDRLHFEPHDFTVEKHRQAALALTGRHLELECEECHKVPVEGVPRVFRGTLSKCVGCHRDAHTGFFDEFAREFGEVKHGSCSICHFTTSFSDVADGFDHGQSTGFAVEGAHDQLKCETCHPPSEEPDEFNRTFGRVNEHFGEYQGCITCHTDPHQGEFDTPKLPAEVDGRRGCARCHEQVSFRTAADTFEHGKWTVFPLEGRHLEVGCSACHQPLRKADELGRTWARAASTECSKCHQDPHDGQFEKRGRIDCGRCHRTADSFHQLSFRHNLDSRFRLGEAHAKLACSKCHKPIGDTGVVLYRPMGRRCVDCHGSNATPFSRRLRGGRK